MPSETKEYLTKCVVDTLARKFYIYSNEGTKKVITCETIKQFMSVLKLVRSDVRDDLVTYINPFEYENTYN